MTDPALRQSHELTGGDDRPFELVHHRPRTDGDGAHAALVFPGRNYGGDLPLLYYTRMVLLNAGAEVFELRYHYADVPETSAEHFAPLLEADVRAAWAKIESIGSYQRLTLVGKSFGTLALARALDMRADLFGEREPHVVGLTPLFAEELVREPLLAFPGKSLYVIGTVDKNHSRAVDDQIHHMPRARMLVLQGAGEGAEIERDPIGSLQVMHSIMTAVRDHVA